MKNDAKLKTLTQIYPVTCTGQPISDADVIYFYAI